MTVTLVFGWRCLDCDEHGEGPTSDKQAEKHTKASQHGTTSWGRPEGRRDVQDGAGGGQGAAVRPQQEPV
jgi:hypothetical protein